MPLQRYEKEEILDACFAAFAQHGYEHTSTALLAQAAGVSKALLFHHFGSKKELYLQVLDRLFERGKAEISFDTPVQDMDFFEMYQRTSMARFEYYTKHPDAYRLIQEAFFATPDELRAEIEEKYGGLKANRNERLERMFEEVPLRPGVDRSLAFRLVMMVLEYVEGQYLRDLQSGKILDEAYVRQLFQDRSEFMNLIQYGIAASQ